MTKRIFVTDCEGPLTKNDNAQEVAERFLPDGAQFFARLSRFDDFLADVAHRPGYNAGDTLRLLPPFLTAFEVSDEEIELFSAESVLLVPGALKLLDRVRGLMPSYIISTSYTPYLEALSLATGFPLANIRCTEVSLDQWEMPQDEKAWLRDELVKILARPLITIPDGATSVDDLCDVDRETVVELEELFWRRMQGRISGRMLDVVRPVGGAMKLAALEEILAREDARGADVMYVGDSITDVPALAAVQSWGGVALSFNGNGYALAAAEFAAASPDAQVTARLAAAFARGGREAVVDAVRRPPKPKADKASAGKARVRVGVVAEQREALAEASAAMRRSVRGEHIARLG